jgi:hypothetical protein
VSVRAARSAPVPSVRVDELPTVEFDMVKEALVAFGVVLGLVLACAAIFGGPYRPAVTIRQVARSQPVAVVATAARDLLGQSRLDRRGAPYQAVGTTQHLGPFDPERWFGVTHPVDPPVVDVLQPLRRASLLDPALGAALRQWTSASAAQRAAWGKAFEAALPQARVVGSSTLVLPPGAAMASGPLPTMMDGELALARAGLLGAAIDGPGDVYHYNVQNSLLFLQGDVLHAIAARRDLLGSQWGILHEEGPYPGPWWVAPYAFLYQIPPYSTSPSGDLMAASTMATLFLILLAVPLLPGLRDLPRHLRVYRLIWRDYYRWVRTRGRPYDAAAAPAPVAARLGQGGATHGG